MSNNQEKELILLQDLGMLYPNETSKQKRRYGLYKCFCGNEFKSQIANIKNNHTKRCMCCSIKNKITHNMSSHKLYKTWHSMVQRCTNIKYKNYKDYGGRGITVCNEWLSVINFINDMNDTYKEGLSIDRIDNNKGYSKDNCRWTTRTVQARNKRKLMSTNTSGYKGLCWSKAKNKWLARIKIASKRIHIGIYDDKVEAAKAYDKYITDNNLEHTKNSNLTLSIE